MGYCTHGNSFQISSVLTSYQLSYPLRELYVLSCSLLIALRIGYGVAAVTRKSPFGRISCECRPI